MDLVMYCIGYFMLRQKINAVHFVLYQMSIWFILSFFGSVYSIYRFTKPTEIISKIVLHIILIISNCVLSIFKTSDFQFQQIFFILNSVTVLVVHVKIWIVLLFKIYRVQTKRIIEQLLLLVLQRSDKLKNF
jgi:putative colanic acid biosynthesis UDP-glucose lipid carrier transferase